MHEISASSREYVLIPISAKAAGVAIDPTADTVEVAFIAPTATPSVSDWKTASWETDATTDPDVHHARCLVGPGGAVVLAAGTYKPWVKISDSPEAPVLRAEGFLKVF